MARRYLRITPETTWGTFNAVGTPIIVDLDQANSYDVRPRPMRWSNRTAGAGNRRYMTGSSKKGLTGNLNMLVHGSQAPTLLPLIVATSAGVLPSCTIDYVFLLEDGSSTKVYHRHLGMMVQQAAITASEQQQLVRFALQLVGKTTATITVADFPEPAAADYATDAYYVFEHLSGGVVIGTSRTEFESLNITIKNLLDVRFFESGAPTRIKYCGRDVDWTSKLAHKVQTDRTSFEATTAVSASALFTNGAHTMTFDFQDQNFFSDVKDDQDDNKVFLQEINLESYFDPLAATPNDFTGAAT